MSDHLPQELLAEILSRLPVKSILICRCVSKTCVRKIVNIPRPNVTFTSHGFHKHSHGFGFDSSTGDYKLVRIVYLPDSNLNFDKIPPLVEIYSLRSRGWRKVDNDLKCVIPDFSTSAFLNGTCHWVATKPPNGPGVCDAILSFSLGEEVFGEMEVPDCLAKKYHYINVAVSDGSLLLVAFTETTEERAFQQSGEVLLVNGGEELFFYDPKTEEFSYTEIWGTPSSFYLDTLVESLVLLDEPNEFAEEEPSEDDGSSGVSNENSSSPDGVNMDLQKNNEGNQNANSPIILNEANEIWRRLHLLVIHRWQLIKQMKKHRESPFLQNEANDVLGRMILLRTFNKFQQLNVLVNGLLMLVWTRSSNTVPTLSGAFIESLSLQI
ncbi:hypothetical protein GH714_001525 [Hevea brasiliensis]|uniref:F-box domain-containing protein n=1 Tax=Hevea brasiliensis TaxID=3981 RepID=A0A6A6KZL4_HEVBR|nr:hypothetical protein GH714_001525 [Hevea brasiliensis]